MRYLRSDAWNGLKQFDKAEQELRGILDEDADENLCRQYRDRVEIELHRSLDYFDRQFNHLSVDRVLVCVPDKTGLVEFLNGEN